MIILLKIMITVLIVSGITITIEKRASSFAIKYYIFMFKLLLKIFIVIIIVICIVILIQNGLMI
jgi:hypothetical protein